MITSSNNPIESVKAPGGFTAGERTLSDDEVAQLWRVLPTALARSKACQRILQVALITGQRLGEISGMTRAARRGKADIGDCPANV
jgi:integrase